MLYQVLDIIAALLLLVGAFLTLAAAIGLIRLPDVLTRMHAVTKPQTLGLVCALLGVGLYLRQPALTGVLLLAIVLQMLTAPVAAHMIARTAYRTLQVRHDLLEIDELADDLASAGFTRAASPGDGDTVEGSSDDPSDTISGAVQPAAEDELADNIGADDQEDVSGEQTDQSDDPDVADTDASPRS